MRSDDFDAYYYQHCCGMPYVRNDEWLRIFGHMADRIVQDIAPRRVLDAGCAMGFLVEALRARGVDASGVDLSDYAIAQVHPTARPYCRVGSITDDLGGDFDLIVSIEVAEHMPAPEAERAIANICAHTTDVLFSSSPLDFREPTHVNVREPEHWAELFARHGFFRDVDYDASFITPWAARFRRSAEPIHRLVRQYERRYWALARAAHDARAYATDVQREAGRLEHELSDVRAENDAMRPALHDAQQRAARATETIGHMERSLFWRARLAWLSVRRLLSRQTPPT